MPEKWNRNYAIAAPLFPPMSHYIWVSGLCEGWWKCSNLYCIL